MQQSAKPLVQGIGTSYNVDFNSTDHNHTPDLNKELILETKKARKILSWVVDSIIGAEAVATCQPLGDGGGVCRRNLQDQSRFVSASVHNPLCCRRSLSSNGILQTGILRFWSSTNTSKNTTSEASKYSKRSQVDRRESNTTLAHGVQTVFYFTYGYLNV